MASTVPPLRLAAWSTLNQLLIALPSKVRKAGFSLTLVAMRRASLSLG